MFLLHATFVLLLLTFISSIFSVDVTYEELKELNATCDALDNCKIRREHDSLENYTCHCYSDCYKLETCCIDSRYRNHAPRSKPNCRRANGKDDHLSYFIMDYCPSGRNRNSMYESMCKDDWTPEEDNLMVLVPATSLSTNVTYKNFFCLRCNEPTTHKFFFWNVRINANGESNREPVPPTYSIGSKTWTAPVGKNGKVIPVALLFEIPEEIRTLPKVCSPNAIANCSSQWENKDIKAKCGMYTSYMYTIKGRSSIVYRNPHCALCNFENLKKMQCGIQGVVKKTVQRRPYTFSQVLDINRPDWDKVWSIQRCNHDATWDPFYKKCRTLKCSQHGYKVKDGKCIPSY